MRNGPRPRGASRITGRAPLPHPVARTDRVIPLIARINGRGRPCSLEPGSPGDIAHVQSRPADPVVAHKWSRVRRPSIARSGRAPSAGPRSTGSAGVARIPGRAPAAEVTWSCARMPGRTIGCGPVGGPHNSSRRPDGAVRAHTWSRRFDVDAGRGPSRGLAALVWRYRRGRCPRMDGRAWSRISGRTRHPVSAGQGWPSRTSL